MRKTKNIMAEKLSRFNYEGKSTYQLKEWWCVEVLGFARDKEIGFVKNHNGKKISIDKFAIDSDMNEVFRHVVPTMLSAKFTIIMSI